MQVTFTRRNRSNRSVWDVEEGLSRESSFFDLSKQRSRKQTLGGVKHANSKFAICTEKRTQVLPPSPPKGASRYTIQGSERTPRTHHTAQKETPGDEYGLLCPRFVAVRVHPYKVFLLALPALGAVCAFSRLDDHRPISLT